jgi:penicillin amidase
MKIRQAIRAIRIVGATFDLCRTPEGVVEMWGENDLSLATATGFVHAMDRMLQMMLVRLIGQGRICECLRETEESLAMDEFFRLMGFYRNAQDDARNLAGDALRFAENYCAGVNEYLFKCGYPWEFKIMKYKPEPWVVADTLLAMNLMFYVPLAQSQQDAERLIIQAVQSGADPSRLKKLFRPHLDGMNDQLIELIKKTQINRPFLPSHIGFLSGLPAFVASNNWVISGSRTASGKPLQCFDPHVECNRLPALWYELIQHTGDNFRIGMNMPGIPGLLMGRTRELSFSFTYGYMDMLDHYIEHVRDNQFRRGPKFQDFAVRDEVIRRKRCSDVKLKVWENEHGVLESEPGADTLKDGYYLCQAWSGHRGGAARSIKALYEILNARTVCEAQRIVADITASCNWLIADTQGSIGYQQSGCLPLRAHSGLHPVPGWEEQYDWQGYATGDQLARLTNPREGYLATANNDFNQEGKPLSINLPVGSYRADRIKALLREQNSSSVEDMKAIQRDLHSRQAVQFLNLLLPHIPESPVGNLLRAWDCRYNKQSRAASLFEEIYGELLEKVFGKGLFGLKAWRHIVDETAVLTHFYHIFDNALLGEDTSWFGSKGRPETLREVVRLVLGRYPEPQQVPAWGSQRQVTMTNLFFDGKLPRFLRFDYGPVIIEGGRASIVQGAAYRFWGRTTSLSPTYRFIADLADNYAHTALAGGPSDRWPSKYYRSDIHGWQNYDYKILKGDRRRGSGAN